MGMQVSSYEVIAALGGDTDDEYVVFVRKALADFTMVAIVLHRPGIDEVLGAALQRQFAHLDRTTGKHLLFFALTDAGADWHEYAGQRSYYRALHAAAQYAHPNCLEWADADAAATAIAGRLGIPSEALPCIVFSEDLARNEFAWMQTGPETLARQLIALGRLAADLAPMLQAQRSMPPRVRRLAPARFDLQAVAASASGGAPCGVGDPAKRLVDVCLDVIAVGAMNSAGFIEREKREERARQVLAGLEAEVAILRRSLGGDHEELAEKVYELAVLRSLALAPNVAGARNPQSDTQPATVRFAAISQRPVLTAATALMLGLGHLAHDLTAAGIAHFCDPEPWQTWHGEAKNAVATADKLLQKFADDPNFDWSTVTVSTGKALEIEANYSVVQMMRRQLGAQMPEYYHKFAPGIPLRMTSGEITIDLNHVRNGTWAPVTLGVMAHLLRHPLMSEASRVLAGPTLDPAASLAALSSVAFALTDLRNEGAHQHTLPLAKAQQARAELDKLAANGGAEFLSACKAVTAPK